MSSMTQTGENPPRPLASLYLSKLLAPSELSPVLTGLCEGGHCVPDPASSLSSMLAKAEA